MQSRRAEWAAQVRRWRESGLTAREFARRVGINAGTLSHWAWRLGRAEAADHDGRRPVKHAVSTRARFVEVAGTIADRRFELDLGDGRRLYIPPHFEAAGLEHVLAVLAKPAR